MKTFTIIIRSAAILFFTALSGILISDMMLNEDDLTSIDPLQQIISAPYASLDTKSLYDKKNRLFRQGVQVGDPFDMEDPDWFKHYRIDQILLLLLRVYAQSNIDSYCAHVAAIR